MRRILLAVGEPTITLQTARQIRPWLRERQTSLTLLAVIPSASLSPLSQIRRTLDQVEAEFTDAAEKPGILMRIGEDVAAEICRETQRGQYGLVALGTRDHAQGDRTLGQTCQQVLLTCSTPVFAAPPGPQVGQTPQVIIVADLVPPSGPAVDWIIAQCQAQRLNVILYTNAPQSIEPFHDLLDREGIRAQVVLYGQLSAQGISTLSRDRHVRWVVAPLWNRDDEPFLGFASALLGGAGRPVVFLPVDESPHQVP